MKAYFQGRIINEDQINVGIGNRQFLYGDGFFETMLASKGKVKYLQYHIDRIKSALTALNISFPEQINHDQISAIISQLDTENEGTCISKVKIHVWRKAGGTYSPENDEGELIITMSHLSPPGIAIKEKVSFSEKIKNYFSFLSPFKSSSALNYVLAGVEKRERKLDDIIITDNNGNISECLVSNIVWVKDQNIFTPSLETGCISGIGIRVLKELFEAQNREIHEVIASKKSLLNADHVFTTNALGLSHILKIDNTTFRPFKEVEHIFSMA